MHLEEESPSGSPRDTDPRQRRILAIFLPRLVSEVSTSHAISLDGETTKRRPPQGVIIVEEAGREVRSSDSLHAVCLKAERAGVRAGQTVTEARALVSDLSVQYVGKQAILDRLVAVAEVSKSYGTTISWEFPDTVWIDVTGVAHLFGGEDELASIVQEQVRLLGHVTRVCIANGPSIARAIAHYGGPSCQAIAPEDTARALRDLPLLGLPLSKEKVTWLSQLGLFTIGQLRELPRKSASGRLGNDALRILDLAAGHDPEPLVPGDFPKIIIEELEWDEPARGSQPLLFALRGLVARLSARLRGRGEATSHATLTLFHDRAIAKHHGSASETSLEFELAAPLSHEGDLERALRGRIERLSLRSPTVGLRLCAKNLSPETFDQMSLGEANTVGLKNEANVSWLSPEDKKRQFAVLLSEIEADVGWEGVGVLQCVDSFRPEASSKLRALTSSRHPNRKKKARSNDPFLGKKKRVSRKATAQRSLFEGLPPRPLLRRWTRIFLQPRPLGAHLALGECFGLGSELYTIESLRFLERLEGVEWWTPEATSRDYFWAWLRSPHGGTEALFFVDRRTNERFVQALGD